jgi:hypothetical protein
MTNKSPVYALCLALIIIAPAVAGDVAPGKSGGGSVTLESDDRTINVLETSVDFGTFEFGDNTKDVPDFINVTTNDGVNLQANEAGGDGKMSVTVGENTYTLSSPLKVGIGAYEPVAISGTVTDVSGTISAGTNTLAGKFVQTVVPADTVADDYAITVTFTLVST